MDVVTRNSLTVKTHPTQRDERSMCWMEMLNQAFSGWEPADQALERVIDRMERAS